MKIDESLKRQVINNETHKHRICRRVSVMKKTKADDRDRE